MCLCVSVVGMCGVVNVGTRRDLQESVNGLMWALGPELGSSVKVAS